MEKIKFVKVKVIPSTDVDYYQLFKDGVATPYVYSSSYLVKCFCILDDYEATNRGNSYDSES